MATRHKGKLPRGKIKNYNSNYSFTGEILYIVAIVISNKANYLIFLKIILFILAINTLNNNLKKYYNINKFTNNINLSLIIGAVINISIYTYLLFIANELDKKTITSIKDITFIISSLFIIPYMKKTQFNNN